MVELGLRAQKSRPPGGVDNSMESTELNRVDSVNVLVMAPNLGWDPSTIELVGEQVHVLDGTPTYWAELRDEGHHRFAPKAQSCLPQLPSRQQRGELLSEADIILVGYPIPRSLARRGPRLRWVHHTQAGASNYWGTDLWESAITLTTSRGSVDTSVIAQYVIGAVLFFARGLGEAIQQTNAGSFSRDKYDLIDVSSSTIGIIGIGGIGREVARYARSFNMRVLATRNSVDRPVEDDPIADMILPPADIATVVSQSDFLVISTQLTQQTWNLVDRNVLASAKPNSVLINISRGEVVDEDALVEALERGQLRGAILDVFHGELEGRAPRRELLDHPRIILTPHIAAQPRPMLHEGRDLFINNLRLFLRGERLVNELDRRRGY